MNVSVIIPVLNDSASLALLLADLSHADVETVVVDGGSTDDSVATARRASTALRADGGRGRQLREGAAASTRDWLWFLHADSRVDEALLAGLQLMLATPGWGFCHVRLDGEERPLRLIESGINWRSGLSGIATGDQGLFVHRRFLDAIGGVPPLPLMEDVEACRRLRDLAAPRLVQLPLVTSARRWQQHGIVRTVLLMWWLRLRYWAGSDAHALARRYYS